MNSPARSPDVASTGGRDRSSTAWWALCTSAFALFAATTLWFFFGSAFGHLINSDTAVAALLADEILHTGQLQPKTWYFVNSEIWTIGPQFFALPFVVALGLAPAALKLGNLTALCVMLWFVTLPVQRVTRSWPFAVIVATGVLACWSALQVQMIHAQAAYGCFCAQFALLTYLSMRIDADAGGAPSLLAHRPRWPVAVFVLVLLNLVIESPLRATAYWIIPFFAACLLDPLSRRRAKAMIVLSGATLLVGAALHHLLAARLLVDPGFASSFLRSPAGWGINIATVLRGLPVMAGYDDAWAPLTTLPGVASILRISFLAIAVVVVAIAVPFGAKVANVECRFLVRLAAAMFAVVAVILIVGELVVSLGSIRYLLPPAILCVVAFMSLLWCLWGTRSKRLLAVAALFVLIFCGGAVPFVARWPARTAALDCDAPLAACRLQTALVRNGLHKGYATYWNANVTTLASDARVDVCGIHIRPNVHPHRWLVSKTCFDPPEGPRYFVALTGAEIEETGREALTADIGRPDQVVTDFKFEIWIYETAKSKTDWLAR